MATLSRARSKLVILGIGDDGLAGLTEPARRLVMGADIILGAPSILTLLESVPTRKQALEPDMSVALRQVRDALAYANPILVSSGDPLFYGVARYLCDRLGKDVFEVVPHVSSMQLAFARIKESWEDAYLTNLAGRPIEAVIDRIRTAEKIGLFSSEECPPARLARELLERGIDYFRAYVCENLGSPDERVTQSELSDMTAMEFNPLNVMILVRKPNRPDRASRASRHRLFGNPDDAFVQSLPKRGLVTIAEVRSIALASSTFGRRVPSGISARAQARWRSRRPSLLISEPCMRSSRSRPISRLSRPTRRSSASPTCAVLGARAEVLATLPEPDAIFVGGTGRQVDLVLNAAYSRLIQGGAWRSTSRPSTD